jgi:hypothetical protein
MNRISLVPVVLLTAVCATTVRAQQIHPWSMAAQMRVQMQWQRQALMRERALLQMEMRTVRQQWAEQKRLARALTPHLSRRSSLPRPRTKPTPLVTHLHNLTTRRSVLAHRTRTASIRVRPPSQATKNTPMVQIRITVSLNAGRGKPALLSRSALVLKRPGNTVNRYLAKLGSLNAARSSLSPMPNVPAQPMFQTPSIAPVAPWLPAVALGQAQRQLPQAPPAPAQGDKPAQPPAALALLPQPPLPLMHKVMEGRMEAASHDWRQEEATSFFLVSISAPSESMAKPSSSRESGVGQLLTAIAKGRRPPAPTETIAIHPDLVRLPPPLPPLQPRYPVSPWLALE